MKNEKRTDEKDREKKGVGEQKEKWDGTEQKKFFLILI